MEYHVTSLHARGENSEGAGARPGGPERVTSSTLSRGEAVDPQASAICRPKGENDRPQGRRSSPPRRSVSVAACSLVSTPISQHGQQPRLEIYPQSLRVKRPGTGNHGQLPPDRTDNTIDAFSSKSRSRLRFRAINAFPALISQLALTYHETWPTDGRQSKAHLNAWLTYLRRVLPGVGYLWIMEFQTRQAPHYHVFLTIPPDREKWEMLSRAWVRITNGTPDAQWWHGPERGENWIPWTMGSGAYLAKYLDKESQKSVPDGYRNFGRFWGNSQGLEAKPIEIPLDDIDDSAPVDEETGEVYGGSKTVLRWLGRLAEKQTRGFSRFRLRSSVGSYTMLEGSMAYRQIERYLDNQRKGRIRHESEKRPKLP